MSKIKPNQLCYLVNCRVFAENEGKVVVTEAPGMFEGERHWRCHSNAPLKCLTKYSSGKTVINYSCNFLVREISLRPINDPDLSFENLPRELENT